MSNIISAPVSATLALMVQYTRERRSGHELAVLATDPSVKRLHQRQYDRLTEAMNFTTIKALRAGYDMDLLAWLVQGSTDRQLEELACLDSDHETLINAITVMRTPKAPKARKAPQPATSNAEALAAQLRTVDTREAGQALLSELKVAGLRDVAKALGMRGISKLRKAELVAHLLHHTVQIRLDHAAILNFGRKA